MLRAATTIAKPATTTVTEYPGPKLHRKNEGMTLAGQSITAKKWRPAKKRCTISKTAGSPDWTEMEMESLVKASAGHISTSPASLGVCRACTATLI